MTIDRPFDGPVEGTRTWVIDLDGVMWRGDEAVPGSVDAIAELLTLGITPVFCTNHAEPAALKADQLVGFGVADPLVVTALDAAIALTGEFERIAVLGSASAAREIARDRDSVDLNAQPPWTLPSDIDVVVVGPHAGWDRERIGAAATLIREGARFVATNTDPLFPTSTPDGRRWILPGNGALVAAVATTSGVEPVVAGKPEAPTAQLLADRFGPIERVVGDRIDTDGGLAVRLGARFGLVTSGGTDRRTAEAAATDPAPPTPIDVAADLAELVGRLRDSPEPSAG